SSSASFRLSTSDTSAVDQQMRSRQDITWAVVSPETPDYVLRYLSVVGPDGRSFRLSDVPAATPVSSVADELVGTDQPTVVEHVNPEGGARRMNPDTTLAEEGVGEGDRLRVGFERRAA